MFLSHEFIIAVRMSDKPQYRLAQVCGLNPVVLSRWLRGASIPNEDNDCLLKLADYLHVSRNQIFKRTKEYKRYFYE